MNTEQPRMTQPIEDTSQPKPSGTKGRTKLETALKYIGLALVIVVANWSAGNSLVNNILAGQVWVRVALGVVASSLPFLAFRGERGRRFFAAYVSVIIAALVFMIGRVNDIITGAIPDLLAPSPNPTNLVLIVIFLLLVAFLLWQIDYLKEIPKIVKTQLEKRKGKEVNEFVFSVVIYP